MNKLVTKNPIQRFKTGNQIQKFQRGGTRRKIWDLPKTLSQKISNDVKIIKRKQENKRTRRGLLRTLLGPLGYSVATIKDIGEGQYNIPRYNIDNVSKFNTVANSIQKQMKELQRKTDKIYSQKASTGERYYLVPTDKKDIYKAVFENGEFGLFNSKAGVYKRFNTLPNMKYKPQVSLKDLEKFQNISTNKIFSKVNNNGNKYFTTKDEKYNIFANGEVWDNETGKYAELLDLDRLDETIKQQSPFNTNYKNNTKKLSSPTIKSSKKSVSERFQNQYKNRKELFKEKGEFANQTIKEVQRQLKVKDDGIWGPKTEEAYLKSKTSQENTQDVASENLSSAPVSTRVPMYLSETHQANDWINGINEQVDKVLNGYKKGGLIPKNPIKRFQVNFNKF